MPIVGLFGTVWVDALTVHLFGKCREGLELVAFGQAEVRQVQVRADLADAKRLVTEIEARPKILKLIWQSQDKVRQQEAADEAAEKVQLFNQPCHLLESVNHQERLEKKRLAEKRRCSQIETAFVLLVFAESSRRPLH